MKKKVFSLMMTLLLAFIGVAKAEVVTIGDGTGTTYYCPFNSLWGYSFVEQVYTADEIGTAGTINSISFNMSSTDAQTNAIDVFMKNVSRSNFSGNTDWETVTASDMVFSGTVTFTNGWTTITLDTPFEYDGTSNLMIGMHEYTCRTTATTSRLTSPLVAVLWFPKSSISKKVPCRKAGLLKVLAPGLSAWVTTPPLLAPIVATTMPSVLTAPAMT